MTHTEFVAWLDGYLTGRVTADAALIRQKMGEVKEPAPFDWWKVGTPVFGAPSAPLTSGDSMPIHPYTTCDSPGIPAVARVLATGMMPLGADFEAVWEANTDTLYQA